MTVEYETKQLTPAQVKIILDTVPILEEAGETLTQKFYQRMIGNYDEVKPFSTPLIKIIETTKNFSICFIELC